jgi:hypothetical protein
MVSARVKMLVLAIALLVTAMPAHAGPRRAAPIDVKMVAYVGETVAGPRPDFIWPAMYQGKKYTLNVLNIVVFGGGATPLGIDAALALYRVKFQLAGEQNAVRRLTTAPPGQQLRILGYLRLDRAGRYLMLNSVEHIEATPTPSG